MSTAELLPACLGVLRALDSMAPSRLALITDAQASRRPAPDKWCCKEELGHLCDSASINHQRILVTLLTEQPTLSGYDQRQLVTRHAYAEQDWVDLIQLWQGLIIHILMATDNLTPTEWQRPCVLESTGNLTLSALLTHFVSHQCHHLHHIGIRMDDLSALCE